MKKISKSIKLIVTIGIALLFVWFLVLSPMITFHNNEKKLEDAARRYFELNPNQLPTGERIKTVKLKTLYRQSYIEGDLYVPYTHKTCSIEDSWVKVRRENGEFKYYTYLQCGVLSSVVDHKGPEIKLEGKMEETVEVGGKFKDPGIRSVVDNVDGTMKASDVVVKGNVDTSKVGTYEITYTSFDSLSNKSSVTRKVVVVQTLYSTVKDYLGDLTNYMGDEDANYVRLSSMLYRIYGYDTDKNIILVADEDVANVNYTKIDKWLDYYYDHLNDFTKKAIVKKKYCNMTLTDTTLDTTQCNQYTNERNIYIPSVIDINKAEDELHYNFMEPTTISWTANPKNKKEAYVTRDIFYENDVVVDKKYDVYETDRNYGVRPMFTIKGDLLIVSGDGTYESPYTFGDVKKAKGGTPLNERYTGEYITIDNFVYRIVEPEKDGTTRVIAEATVAGGSEEVSCLASPEKKKIVYDTKDTGSVAYYINNTVTAYVDTSFFANHEVEIPIYEDKIIYGEEVETKKIKAKMSAPNMYEMFAAQPQKSRFCSSFWLINSSKADRKVGAIYLVGVPLNDEVPSYARLYIRIAGYIKKGTVISSGDGTIQSPYAIK